MPPVSRTDPYPNFNFLVDLQDGSDPASPQAGFMEVTGLDVSVSVIEYRNGNEAANTTRKIPGLARAPEIRLRRGLNGSNNLYAWMQAAATGHRPYRTVTIKLMNEDHSQVVATWKLINAIPIRYDGPSLTATADDLAMEELVLACQSIVME